PVGQDVIRDVEGLDKLPKERIMGDGEELTSIERSIVNFKKSKIIEASKQAICFEELYDPSREHVGRWCYYDGYIFSSSSSGTTGSLDIETAKSVITRELERRKLKKK